MAVNAYGRGPVQIDKAADVLIAGIVSQSVNTGSEFLSDPQSDEIYSRLTSLVRQAPGAAFSTVDLKTALDAIGITGLALIIATPVWLVLYAQKHAQGGTRGGAGEHRSFTIKDGIVAPAQLSARGNGNAVLSYRALASWDGANDPVIATDAVSIPAITSDVLRYALGPVTIGGIALSSIQSVDIDFGVALEADYDSSEILPRRVGIRAIQPIVTIRGIDPQWLDSATVTKIPLLGQAALHADTSIYFRKRAAGGTFVADGTAGHIKLTAHGMVAVETIFDAGGGPGESAVVLRCDYDGTNAPIVINTASAIT